MRYTVARYRQTISARDHRIDPNYSRGACQGSSGIPRSQPDVGLLLSKIEVLLGSSFHAVVGDMAFVPLHARRIFCDEIFGGLRYARIHRPRPCEYVRIFHGCLVTKGIAVAGYAFNYVKCLAVKPSI